MAARKRKPKPTDWTWDVPTKDGWYWSCVGEAVIPLQIIDGWVHVGYLKILPSFLMCRWRRLPKPRVPKARKGRK